MVRLHVPVDLGVGRAIDLDEDKTRYLRAVMRLPVGAELVLFNGLHGEYSATIAAYAKRSTALAVGELLRPQPPLDPAAGWLVMAPLKRARLDSVIEKATELGVARILPVLTSRTVPERMNLDRLRAIAVEAAEQCERLDLPEIAEPLPLDRLLSQWPQDRRLFACVERGGTRPLVQVAAEHPPGLPWAVLIGPEGGYAAAELDALTHLAFVSAVGLGPRVLRADTAAFSALAVLQSVLGDWHRPARG